MVQMQGMGRNVSGSKGSINEMKIVMWREALGSIMSESSRVLPFMVASEELI